MIEGIELLCQQIAESIEEAIEEEWTVAWMQAVFFPGASQYTGEYERKLDGKARDFGTTSSGARAFRELRKKFKEAGQPVWGQAVFELRSDGKFTMKWGYDNCDENGDTIFNAEEDHKLEEERHERLTS